EELHIQSEAASSVSTTGAFVFMPQASAPLSAIADRRLFFFRQILPLPASRSELPTSLRRSELQIFRMILIAITSRLCERACRFREFPGGKRVRRLCKSRLRDLTPRQCQFFSDKVKLPYMGL